MSFFHFAVGSASKDLLLSGTVRSHGFLRIVLLTAASITTALPAKAATFWVNDDPMRPSYSMESDAPPAPPVKHRENRIKQQGIKLEKRAAESAKPVGPVVINISIDQQVMRVFDANGLFAETRVSTGMRGHATPMGVFSIIQKNKWHKSNIYSGAPMPYMQRITWSGIALHAGALPGYAASHGCIRMPMAFATKLWGWTRMGARVIITPGEVSPSDIRHPQLIAQRPVPVAATAKPAEIKSGDLGMKLAPAPDLKPAKTQTADASNAIVGPGATVMSDAGSKAAPLSVTDAGGTKSATPTDKPVDDTTRVTRQDVDAAAATAAELPTAKPVETPLSAPPNVPSENKAAGDTTRTEAKPAAAKSDAVDIPPPPDTSPKRTGQIAVLISGKDGKLYVRQNFSPLFETPITIKPSDRPLGTHVFTARMDKDEAKSIHWTAVSLPAVPHRALAEETAPRHRKSAAVAEAARPLTDSPIEALDRVSIPEDAMTQIADAIASGGSIIVSDQSIKAGGETGQGTEFVIPLR